MTSINTTTEAKPRPTTKPPRAAQWPSLPVADLTAHMPVPEPDPAMVESVAVHGITDPLYVAALDNGTFRVVDGMRRLTAVVAAALDAVPVTYRPVIRVDALTKHPGNVRRNLALTREFRASIREHGIRTAVLVRRTAAGLEVVDGHRRLLGAVSEGLTHIPYTYDEVSDAAAYVDMVTTAVHRAPLTTAEQAVALFEAAELGASARELAAAAGKTQKEARVMVKAGGSKTVAKVAEACLTLSDLARLAELEEHAPDLAKDVEAAITAKPLGNHSWRITDALSKAAARKEAAEHRAQLEAQGATFRTLAELSEKAVPVYRLAKVSAEEHAACQGHVWVLTTLTAGRGGQPPPGTRQADRPPEAFTDRRTLPCASTRPP
jgi:ParB family transcriptional regulator, chromosome partitioning protein